MIWAGTEVWSVPRQFGVAAEGAADATTALRMPGRWAAWPGRVRKEVQARFDANPLRRQRAAWVALCGGCEGFEFIAYVLEHGLAVCAPAQRPVPFVVPNHGSCADPVRGPIAAEVLAGEVREGMLWAPSPWLRARCQWVHALGVLHKAPGKVRVIHDFSAPAAGSLNNCIDYVRLRYDGIDEAFAGMRPGCYMAKIDITAFFRHVGLDPADWELMSFEWHSELLTDTRLNFGQRNAPEVAYRFAMAVKWAVLRALEGLHLSSWAAVRVVCDDWKVQAGTYDACMAVWRTVLWVLRSLGFAINELPHKSVPPTQLLIFLGLQFDSVRMTVALPAAKLAKAVAVIAEVLVATKVTRRQLDRLFGYLQYCANVVFGGRAFLHSVRRLRFRSDGVVRGAWHKVHVSSSLRRDMRWWLDHLGLLNGDRGVPIVARTAEADALDIFLDARGGPGGVGVFCDGAFLGLTGAETNARYPAREAGTGAWCALASPGVARRVDTGAILPPSREANHWELFAFAVLLDVFPDVLRDRFVVVHSDSVSAIKCVRDFSAALDSPEMAHLTRVVLGQMVRLNVRIRPQYVPGVDNVLADPLSRDKVSLFAGRAQAWLRSRGWETSSFLASVHRCNM